MILKSIIFIFIQSHQNSFLFGVSLSVCFFFLCWSDNNGRISWMHRTQKTRNLKCKMMFRHNGGNKRSVISENDSHDVRWWFNNFIRVYSIHDESEASFGRALALRLRARLCDLITWKNFTFASFSFLFFLSLSLCKMPQIVKEKDLLKLQTNEKKHECVHRERVRW